MINEHDRICPMLFQYIMIAEQTVVAGLYCRLSRDDNNGHLVSMSIKNQVKMLTEYAAENAWDVYDVNIDDGFSGTNFERPNFQRMLKDAERGCINCIVTKDCCAIMGLNQRDLENQGFLA